MNVRIFTQLLWCLLKGSLYRVTMGAGMETMYGFNINYPLSMIDLTTTIAEFTISNAETPMHNSLGESTSQLVAGWLYCISSNMKEAEIYPHCINRYSGYRFTDIQDIDLFPLASLALQAPLYMNLTECLTNYHSIACNQKTHFIAKEM